MGGEIGVLSEEGSGSEFWFEMTLQLQEGQASQSIRKDLGGRRILVHAENLREEILKGLKEPA